VRIEDGQKLKSLNVGPSGSRRQGRKRRSSPTRTSVLTKMEPRSNLVFGTVEETTRNVIFRPNPGPQEAFLEATEFEVLFGGAAGGGKSYGILADAARDLGHPEFRGLIVRRTTEELRELIDKSQSLYPKIYPGIKWSERKSEWTMPNGGKLSRLR
jgi:hypothetical protein